MIGQNFASQYPASQNELQAIQINVGNCILHLVISFPILFEKKVTCKSIQQTSISAIVCNLPTLPSQGVFPVTVQVANQFSTSLSFTVIDLAPPPTSTPTPSPPTHPPTHPPTPPPKPVGVCIALYHRA